MITIDQLSTGLLKFADAEIIPALKSTQRWLVTGILFAMQDKIPSMIKDYPLIKALKLVDENGMIDDSALKKAVKIACNKEGSLSLDIPTLGTMELSEKDFDKLFSFITADKKENE